MMRRTIQGLALGVALAAAVPVHAADSLEPAVNTSAPDRLAVPARAPAATPDAPSSAATGSDASTARTAPTTVATPSVATPGAAPRPSAAKPAQPTSASAATPPAATGGSARDRVELENTQITGNRELPKVMYVVPWKKPDLGDFGGRPAKSLLDELLEPVDRDVFKRQTRYFDALQPDGGPSASGDEK